LAPYKFSAAPTVRINGTFDLMKGRSLNDARFEVNGGPFQWVEFRCPRIHGQVHWLGDDVTLTNVVAEFYGGQIAGHAFFDATTARGTRFSFLAMVAEVNLHTLMADISSRTNKLEGTLDGELAIDSANTDDPKSWRGHGRVNLRDGLIWEFPIFGIFSPALNAVSPGLGNSRARHGSATFTIKDGAVQSKDLQLQASGARLDYSGSVDFDTKVRGKMEAELFRNVPLVGKVMSLMLWPVTKIFEYKISGTLAQPKAEPVYVPGFLVHPFRSIKGIFPEEPKPPPEK
ncbi:MAG TPA: AsmA-like C-terminal region-containing protein, partial [Candidatus Eisenbacteria bacterium]|nr:AsmA-like C-terminal region-containing protein [Candidatus Eisenbacteria bacterium]